MSAAPDSCLQKGKVLLINPNLMRPPVVPIALDYLASALEASGFQVDALDLCFSDDVQGDIDDCFGRNAVLAVVISLRNADDTFFATQDFCLDHYRSIVDYVKTRTNAPIVLGGSGFSIMPQQVLSHYGLNLGIWGEGEYSLPLLLRRIAANEDYRDVPGLICRTESGFHARPPTYVDLSHTAAPGRTAVDNYRYYVEGGMGAVETKRGCPGQCIYCVDPVGKGRSVRMRSPRSVADEIESLLGMGIDHLHFCDSEINIPEEHARAVCLEMMARGLGERVRWYTYATPKGFNRELAQLFRRAGCVGINFGVDSASESMLRTLGRGFAIEDLSRTADVCREEGIATLYDLLLGGPGETGETMRETIDTMRSIAPDRVGASLGIRVFPHTKLAEMVSGEGPLEKNPSLHGRVSENDNLFYPVYYLSAELGPEPQRHLASLIGEDERFFFFGGDAGADRNYNYNDNTVLCEAIREGHRGAFWDILRRLQERG
jgi:radical SAM superfamily enzyme YgiQ (UPF0313 family)